MPRPRKGTTADDSEASATATSIANSTPVSPSPSLNASSAAIPPPETDDVDNKEKLAAEAKAKKAEEEAAVKYHCDYCRKDISHGIRIKCAVCTDFDLCVECFSVGVEVTPHKNNHAYQVMDRVNFPLFDEHWDAEEELLLLEAIGKYGLGNWEDIADHVGTKTLAECREHYFGTYIDVASYPLPDTSNILTTSSTLAERKREADTVGKVRKRAKKVQAKPVDQASSKTLPGQRPVGVVGGAASSTAGGANYASAPVSLDQAGYMPLRREFETEYHNDAETVIAPLTFDEGDTAEETEAKYRVLELYNRKLVERYMRREFVISRNLMNLKRLYERERSLSREDRELQARLRVFIQVLSRDDFDTFVDGLVAERRLRRRIDSLQRWRAAGCRTLVAGERFAAERRRRSQDATRRGRYDSASAAAAAAANERRERLEALSRWNHKVPKPRAKPTLLSMEGLPSVELLSQRESDLCSELRLYPKQYLLVKERVLVEALENDSVLSKAQMRAIIRLDAGKLARLYDFFEKAGWINNAAQQQLAHVVAQHVASAAKTAATTTDTAV